MPRKECSRNTRKEGADHPRRCNLTLQLPSIQPRSTLFLTLDGRIDQNRMTENLTSSKGKSCFIWLQGCHVGYASTPNYLDIQQYRPHFLEKNDMIFPCPAFFPGALTAAFFFGGGAGSSSEKDSHAGSSTVTKRRLC